LEAVKAELAKLHFPWPADFLPDATPQAGIEYGRQVASVLLGMVTDAAASLAGPAVVLKSTDGLAKAVGPAELDTRGDEDQPVVSEVLNGVAMMVVGATHALVALGVLPVEAEEALSVGNLG
jgi:hypothetical protein